jgi:hypothetical protein
VVLAVAQAGAGEGIVEAVAQLLKTAIGELRL